MTGRAVCAQLRCALPSYNRFAIKLVCRKPVTCAEFFPTIVNGSRTLGTTSVQLSERKNGFLTPKRHQIKHLEFVIPWFGTRESKIHIRCAGRLQSD